MSDHEPEAERRRDELIAKAREMFGAAWDAAVGDAKERIRMVAEAQKKTCPESAATDRGGNRRPK